jgi:hypothetical protein
VETTTTLDFNHYRSLHLHFIPDVANNNVSPASTGKSGGAVTVSSTFDYEKIKPGDWKLHIDVTLEVNGLAKIITRSSFTVEAEDVELFTKEMMIFPVAFAIDTCLISFEKLCKDNNLSTEPVARDGFVELIKSYAEHFCHEYFEYRRLDDINNSAAMMQGLHMGTGNITWLVMFCTFKVLDEVMFRNPHFNHKNNVDQVGEIMPITQYTTLQLNSHELKHNDVNFTLKDTICLLILMDAALQLLVSDHLYKLEQPLSKASVTADKIEAYIKYASEMLRDFKSQLKHAHIPNLEVKYDWAKLIA